MTRKGKAAERRRQEQVELNAEQTRDLTYVERPRTWSGRHAEDEGELVEWFDSRDLLHRGVRLTRTYVLSGDVRRPDPEPPVGRAYVREHCCKGQLWVLEVSRLRVRELATS